MLGYYAKSFRLELSVMMPLRKCRIAMDARMLTDAQTGVGTYAHALRRAIGTLTDEPVLITDRRNLAGPMPAPLGKMGRRLRALWPGARKVRIMAPKNAHETALMAPDIFRLAQVYFDLHRCPLPIHVPGPPGIVHWTYALPIRLVGWSNLYTIHDAIPITVPTLTPIEPRRHRHLIEAIARHAAAFVTVSDAARTEILAAFDLAAAPIVNCSEAVDVGQDEPTAPLPVGLQAGRYMLVVGAVEIRKNIGRIIAAHRLSGINMPLVIAGPDGWGAETIARDFKAPLVKRLPYLPRESLRTLIAGARAVIQVSLAEGFGLPVVEAMALGVPVITSDRGALAETAGGAALVVDPLDTATLASAIQCVARDDSIQQQLRKRGLIRAQAFAPPFFADKLGQLYRSVLGFC